MTLGKSKFHFSPWTKSVSGSTQWSLEPGNMGKKKVTRDIYTSKGHYSTVLFQSLVRNQYHSEFIMDCFPFKQYRSVQTSLSIRGVVGSWRLGRDTVLSCVLRRLVFPSVSRVRRGSVSFRRYGVSVKTHYSLRPSVLKGLV